MKLVEFIQVRGVIVVSHKRKEIFSEEVELRTAQLPRLRPHVRIDENRLPDENLKEAQEA